MHVRVEWWLQVVVSESGVLGTHGWLSYDKTNSNFFTFDRDPLMTSPKSVPCFSVSTVLHCCSRLFHMRGLLAVNLCHASNVWKIISMMDLTAWWENSVEVLIIFILGDFFCRCSSEANSRQKRILSIDSKLDNVHKSAWCLISCSFQCLAVVFVEAIFSIYHESTVQSLLNLAAKIDASSCEKRFCW